MPWITGNVGDGGDQMSTAPVIQQPKEENDFPLLP